MERVISLSAHPPTQLRRAPEHLYTKKNEKEKQRGTNNDNREKKG
jgi:hypothetical protein